MELSSPFSAWQSVRRSAFEVTPTTHETETNTSKPSLFARLGGADAVDAVVGVFYDKVLEDHRVRRIFGDCDVRKVARHQTIFLTAAFGGDVGTFSYNIRKIHEHLRLKDMHFDAVLENMVAAMEDFGITEELQEEVLDIMESQRSDVLNLPCTDTDNSGEVCIMCPSFCLW
eukprot:GEMP01037927.1.p1 GENE.GEMP01037927.1~~GEMP01037927.1.p1  ORF type:complete len:172 (+),score=34.95 GEMP01037927.1:99-614(+)